MKVSSAVGGGAGGATTGGSILSGACGVSTYTETHPKSYLGGGVVIPEPK